MGKKKKNKKGIDLSSDQASQDEIKESGEQKINEDLALLAPEEVQQKKDDEPELKNHLTLTKRNSKTMTH